MEIIRERKRRDNSSFWRVDQWTKTNNRKVETIMRGSRDADSGRKIPNWIPRISRLKIWKSYHFKSGLLFSSHIWTQKLKVKKYIFKYVFSTVSSYMYMSTVGRTRELFFTKRLRDPPWAVGQWKKLIVIITLNIFRII